MFIDLEYMQSLTGLDNLNETELKDFQDYLESKSGGFWLDEIDSILAAQFDCFKRKKLFDKQCQSVSYGG